MRELQQSIRIEEEKGVVDGTGIQARKYVQPGFPALPTAPVAHIIIVT